MSEFQVNNTAPLFGERLARMETKIEYILKSVEGLARNVDKQFVEIHKRIEVIDERIDGSIDAQRKHENEDFLEFKEMKKKSKWKIIELAIGFFFGIIAAYILALTGLPS